MTASTLRLLGEPATVCRIMVRTQLLRKDASRTVGRRERMRCQSTSAIRGGRHSRRIVEPRKPGTSLRSAWPVVGAWPKAIPFQIKEITDVWQQTPDAGRRAGGEKSDALSERERGVPQSSTSPAGRGNRAQASHRARGRAAPGAATGWRGDEELSLR